MARPILHVLPLGLGALVLIVCPLLLLANLSLSLLDRGMMKLSPSLDGVAPPIDLRWSLHGLLHGTDQAAYARLIGTRMPLYEDAVRLRNQVEYSLFATSPNPTLLVGRGHVLLERPYLEEYCSRDIAVWQAGAVRWANQIRGMQDAIERQGHAFLYVLTPSKVAQYPAWRPPGYHCPSSQTDRLGIVPAWLAIVRQAGIHVVDTTAVLDAAHGAYPFALFPPGGTHWNAVGQALAMQAILRGLAQQRPGPPFQPFGFTWHMIAHAQGDDTDLADLMNLFTHPWAVPVPAVTYQPATSETCPARRLVIVGGSFGHAIGNVLTALPCHPDVTEYEYWRRETVTWPEGKPFHAPVDEAQRRAATLGADVLVYEENEQVLSNPEAGFALSQFLAASSVR